jgi:hypothetical protein
MASSSFLAAMARCFCISTSVNLIPDRRLSAFAPIPLRGSASVFAVLANRASGLLATACVKGWAISSGIRP